MGKLIISALLFLTGFAFVGCGSSDSGSGDTCHDGCVATMAAKCSNGPSTQEQCESDCNTFKNSKCSKEFAALQTCASGKPVTCSANGQPQLAGCESQNDAFGTCYVTP